MNFNKIKKTVAAGSCVIMLPASLLFVNAASLSKDKQTSAYVGETVTLDQTATYYTSGNTRWSLSTPLIYRSGTNTSLMSVWATQQSRNEWVSGGNAYTTSNLGAHAIDFHYNQTNAYPSITWTYNGSTGTLY